MSRRNRKNQGKLSVLDFIDSEFEDIEKNFYENPVIQSKSVPKNLGPKKTEESGNQISEKRIRTQTAHITRHNRNTNRRQTGHITQEWNTIGTQTTHPTRHNTEHKQNTNGLHSEHKSTYSELVGLQRNLALYFFEMSKFSTERNTPKITIDHINENTKMTKGSIKTTLARLKQKDIVSLVKYKDGRGGWGIYRLSDEIFNEILKTSDSKWNTNGAQTVHKADTKGYTQPDTSTSSSSNNINTTTEESISIDLKPLESIHFSKHHLKQIQDQKILSNEEIQKSIEAFSFDLKNNRLEKVRSPLNFFMKIVKNGSPYVSDHYKDPEDELLKEKLERARREKTEKERMKEELLELKFNEWLEKQEKDELKGLVPVIGEYLGQFHRANLKEYFQQEVFREQN